MKRKIVILSVLAVLIIAGVSVFTVNSPNPSTASESAGIQNIQSESQNETPQASKSSFYGPASVTATVSPDISLIYNGNAQTLRDSSGNTVFPLMFDGSVYVPVRAVAEILGNDVKWSDDLKAVEITPGQSNNDSDKPDKQAEQAEPAELPKTAEPRSPSRQTGQADTSGKLIGEDRARMIALGSAGLAEQSVEFKKCRLTYNDGRQTYDIEFSCNGIEYEFEIDASVGTILESEKEYIKK